MKFISLLVLMTIFAVTFSVRAFAAATHYDTLGVAKNATQDEIKKAFRKKAYELHPDRNPNDKLAEAKFKAVNSAYSVLGDAEQRREYDQFGDADAYQEAPPRPRAQRTVRPSEEIVSKLRRYDGQSVPELIQHALDLMDYYLDTKFNIAFRGRRYDDAIAKELANVLADIWSRTGVQFTDGKSDITEAVYKASFLWLKKFQTVAPEIYNYYYNWAYRQIHDSAESMPRTRQGDEMARRYTDILEFADRFRHQEWSPNLPQHRQAENTTTEYCEILLTVQIGNGPPQVIRTRAQVHRTRR